MNSDIFHVKFPYLGWSFTINRVALQIGSFKIYWYGVIIMTGMLLAVLYAYKSSKRYNVDRNKLFNCVFVGLISGIIGARLYFCIFRWDYKRDIVNTRGRPSDLRRNNRSASRRSYRRKNPEDEVHANPRYFYDGISDWTGNRPMGQFYESGGVRNSYKSSVGNAQRGNRRRCRSSLLPL